MKLGSSLSLMVAVVLLGGALVLTLSVTSWLLAQLLHLLAQTF